MSLHQQGANKGAVTSFLISTPESGADSIAVTYALLDPVMTVIRPAAAFLTAFTAGVTENLTGSMATDPKPAASVHGEEVRGAPGAQSPPLGARLRSELRFAFTDFWGDMAGAFYFGVLLAGAITALMPDRLLTAYLGGGINAMLIMLVAGIPLYICATASTPIAAALILKGVSPGAALVFLLAGPATNAATITVVLRTLGRRSTLIYLASIAVCALLCGMLADAIYTAFDLSAQAVAGEAGEAIPPWLAMASTIALLFLSMYSLGPKLFRRRHTQTEPGAAATPGVSILPSPPTDSPSFKGPT